MTYQELCQAIIGQLRNSPNLDEYFDSLDEIDVDVVAVDIERVSIMDLARFITGVAHRVGWITIVTPTGRSRSGPRPTEERFERVSDDPVPSNPNLYPHGRCPTCGHGVNWAAQCPNPKCTKYVPGAEREEDI